ncbi:hypothetical protein ACQP0U_16515 [Micromonospora sp. CA-269861]|uniref:hypothetical protein n=1 Tax=Micromonospora sp. CA-269861 TaxID=3239968 RepID=UPI003D8F4BBE
MPPVRRPARGNTLAPDTTADDATGLPRSDAPPQPVRSLVFGPHGSPSSHPHRVDAEPARTPSHRPLDAHRPGEVDKGPERSTGSSPARPSADRLPAGRDGLRGDSADGRPRPSRDQRGRRDSAPDTSRPTRGDAASSYERPAWPDLAGADASRTGWTRTGVEDTPTTGRGDLARVVDRGPWLTLPGEPAPPGRQAALSDIGTRAAGGDRAAGIDAPPPALATRSVDRWPALPDDTALWSVAGAALDTAQLTRLDREQAGD